MEDRCSKAMGGRLEFRILGPLVVRVDGTPVPIGGPKQRALLALLLLSANRVVSRDRLIGELFAEQSVNSADHALRNQVSRLRKVLSPAAVDAPRLVARAPGYLLRVEPGELDLENFERLVADGRELLAAGDPTRAATTLRAAELLWEGLPLADLEFEPFARIEIERLEELRLAAVEERIDAELALGRQLALVGEVEALSAEHPYRERFRAQLMLALYRAGRQAEGLEVYRRTRALLSDELGLEPSVELQELERAILIQDPALALDGSGVSAQPPRRDVCPYKGLAPFEENDAEFFFGRERLVEELLARIDESSLLALIGPSGSGKSSLLRAGLLPALSRYPNVLVRPGDGFPVLPAGNRVVVAIDQFEELFAPSVSEAARRTFVGALVDAVWDPERRTVILLAMRADFFGRLAPYVELADLVGPNHVLLGPMTVGELRRAVEGPAEQTHLAVEPELVDALVEDVAGEVGGLPLLSTALIDLWRERDDDTLTLDAYARTGGVRGAVGRHAEAAFRSLDADEQQAARRVLLRLVAGGDGAALTRRRVDLKELDADDDPVVARVLAKLVGRRLLVAGEDSVELVHEALLEQWPRLAGWLDEDARGRRLHAQLTSASATWQTGGREDGELFRGARLAAALDWSDTGHASELNRLEREFLDESRRASARRTRRLRIQLAVALALLAAALVAGAVALRERGRAQDRATAADAQRLGAQGLVEPRLDLALLLAREGVDLDNSTVTEGNLLAVLLRSPAALAIAHGESPRILDDARSPDGRLLVIRSDNGTIDFFDARTLRKVGPALRTSGQLAYFGSVVRPVKDLAFSPDGRTLAVGSTDGHLAKMFLVDVGTHRIRATAAAPRNASTTDVVFAPDGRTVVSGEIVSGRYSPPPLVLVTRRTTDGSLVRRSRAIPGGRLVGFTDGGRSLLVTSGETTSYLLDARTFARIRTFHLSGMAALSPSADVAAFGQDDGSVRLLDLRTGAVRALEGRAQGRVTGIAFAPGGDVLATTSDDGGVEIWDVPTATLRETYTGHAAEAVGPLWSADGTTLYTGSYDGSVIEWDVQGERRLGRPFRFAPVAAPGEGLHRPANGAAWMVAVSPDGSLFVTSPAPGRATLWRTGSQAVVGALRGPFGGGDSFAWSPDGRYLAATGSSETAVVWNVRTHEIVSTFGPLGPHGAAGVEFSPDGKLLATAGIDGTLRVFDLRTGRGFGKAKLRGSLQDLDFSHDGKLLVAAGLEGDIAVWNVAQRRLERVIHHHDAVLTVRFSPDDKELATGDLPGNVDFWDPHTGRQVGRTLGGQNGFVVSVSFNPSGTELLTTSTDGKLRLWDLASGKLIGAPLPGSTVGGFGTFFPDGKHAIAVFGDGTGVVWNVDPAAWAAQACRVAHRDLTTAEWSDFLPDRHYRAVCS
jgi:WD40 repeat protein/DNA-binding SARP family transcriptional activator/energy-coupling factor transporter ATP-binding protein EcfA2